MRESLLFSIIIRTARFVLWACLSMVIILPSTKIYAQDDVEDVEEFFGDDDEDEYYVYEASYAYPVNDGMTITPGIYTSESAAGDTTGVIVKTSFSF